MAGRLAPVCDASLRALSSFAQRAAYREPRLQHGKQSLDLAQQVGDGVHLDLGAEGGRRVIRRVGDGHRPQRTAV